MSEGKGEKKKGREKSGGGAKKTRLVRRSDIPAVQKAGRHHRLVSAALAAPPGRAPTPADYLTADEAALLGLAGRGQARAHAVRTDRCCALTGNGSLCSRGSATAALPGVCQAFCMQHVVQTLKKFDPPYKRGEIPLWRTSTADLDRTGRKVSPSSSASSSASSSSSVSSTPGSGAKEDAAVAEDPGTVKVVLNFRTYDPSHYDITIGFAPTTLDAVQEALDLEAERSTVGELIPVRSPLIATAIEALKTVRPETRYPQLYRILQIWNDAAPKGSTFEVSADMDSDGYVTWNGTEIVLGIHAPKWRGVDPRYRSWQSEFVPVEPAQAYLSRAWAGKAGVALRTLIARLAIAFPDAFFGPWLPSSLDAHAACAAPGARHRALAALGAAFEDID
jgi:hypothetical protein